MMISGCVGGDLESSLEDSSSSSSIKTHSKYQHQMSAPHSYHVSSGGGGGQQQHYSREITEVGGGRSKKMREIEIEKHYGSGGRLKTVVGGEHAMRSGKGKRF